MSKEYRRICDEAIAVLKNNKTALEDILVNCETKIMFNDEYTRTIDLLENIDEQKEYVSKYFDKKMSSYLPLNQPLYSFFLQVFIPSLMLGKVYYRPPKKQAIIHEKQYSILSQVKEIQERIEFCPKSRRDFFKENVLNSDIVNFTGKFDNAGQIIKLLPEDNKIAFIYNGSAMNPIIVGKNADIEKAAEDTKISRLYNSGQDCMAPACIFVHQSIASDFMAKLKKQLRRIKCGANDDEKVEIGPLLSSDSIKDFFCLKSQYKTKYKTTKIYGGNVEIQNNLIRPAIFYFDTVDCEFQDIYYGPYFLVMAYSDNSEIVKYLSTDYARRYSGYISEYGDDTYGIGELLNPQLIELKEETLFTAENGNSEFGGYGEGCNFVKKIGETEFEQHPVLLSKEIYNMFD